MTGNKKGNRPRGSQRPAEVVKKMLSRCYDDLEKKDMPRDAFVNECLGVMTEKMKQKNSSILLPGDF